MNRIFALSSATILSLGLIGCSSSPDKIQAHYVSPLQYENYECDRIEKELGRVSRRVIEVGGAQQTSADNDAAAVGVGMVLFWPALFFLASEDHADELGRLKGEYEALEEIAIKKNCDISEALEEARIAREKLAEENKKKQQQNGFTDDGSDSEQ